MGKLKSEPMSYRAYARHRGVSPEAVSKAVKAGRITAGPDGKIDPKRADREWEANTDPSKPLNSVTGKPRHRKPPDSPKIPGGDVEGASGGALPGGVPPYLQSRSIREAYLARLSKLEFEEKSGKLVNIDAVRVVGFNAVRQARDKLMNMPDRLSPLLAGMSDSHEIHKLLTAEIRLICEELSKDAQSSRNHIP